MEVPVEESRQGFSGTLKSPPNIKMPVWKDESKSQIFRRKETWWSFGQYIFAIVMGLDAYVPLTKMYLPSWSINVSDKWKSACLEISIETPFVLEDGFEECKACLYTWFVSLGMALVRKCVSCSNRKWALCFVSSERTWDLFSGRFRPLTLSDRHLSESCWLLVAVFCIVLMLWMMKEG